MAPAARRARAARSADDLARLVHELRIQRMPRRCDAAVGNSVENRAAGFVQMMAIIETAVGQQRPELRKGALETAFRQVVEAEFLEARRSISAPPPANG